MDYRPIATDKREAIKDLLNLEIQVKTLKAVKAIVLLKQLTKNQIILKPEKK
jgi:hypothetical protein